MDNDRCARRFAGAIAFVPALTTIGFTAVGCTGDNTETNAWHPGLYPVVDGVSRLQYVDASGKVVWQSK
jgi:hypothetical protein